MAWLGVLAVVAAGLILALTVGQWRQGEPPHTPALPAPDGGTAQLDADLWATFATRFIEGGRVIDRDNDNITHSEGQGYGMLLAEAANDRAVFDALWAWTDATLRRPDGLLSWRFGACPDGSTETGCVTDPNNATDGEILIAWALLRAADRWQDPAYHAAAAGLASAAAEHTLVRRHGRLLILPGVQGFEDGADGPTTVNPSYWVFPALEALADAFPDQPWAEVADEGRRLITEGRFGAFDLPPDWLDVSADGLTPSTRFDPVYGFNAVRVPLHLAWSRTAPDEAEMAAFSHFWATATTPAGPPPAWVNLADGSVAPYPWSNGVAAIAKFAQARTANRAVAPAALPRPGAEDGYFSWSLALLTQVAAAEVAP